MTQQQHRAPGIARAKMQPARRRQVEPPRTPAQFEEHQPDGGESRGLVGYPQRVVEPGRLAEEQAFGQDAEAGQKAGRMRCAGFVIRVGCGDPKERQTGGERQRGQSHGETRDRTRVAHLRAVYFRERGTRKTAAKGCVQDLGARGQYVAGMKAVA